MRNLAFFRPSEELSQMLMEEEGLDLPRAGLHGTILKFDISVALMRGFVPVLSMLETEPFEVEVIGIRDYRFDRRSFVLTLNCPKALVGLRQDMMREFMRLRNERGGSISNTMSFYGSLDGYEPHYTISYGDELPDLKHNYIGMRMMIDRYFISRKMGGRYFPLTSFRLGAPVLI